MSLLIPFDQNPVNNVEGASSYTVPAGKYAIVSITLSCSAYSYANGYTNGVSANPSFTASNNSTTATIRLKSGSALTFTKTPASNSSAGSGGGAYKYVTGGSSCSFSVDTVLGGSVKAFASGCSTLATGQTIYIAGDAIAYFSAAEYNNIS